MQMLWKQEIKIWKFKVKVTQIKQFICVSVYKRFVQNMKAMIKLGTKVRCEYSNESQKYLCVAVDFPSYLAFKNKYKINIKWEIFSSYF